jgi:putative transcriptional regulator
MKLSFHPSEELIVDYAAGAMSETWGLAIATHLALCPACRRTAAQMEAVGAQFLDFTPPAQMAPAALAAVMARLDETSQIANAAPPSLVRHGERPILPEPLRTYAGGDVDTLNWRRLGFGAYQFLIPVGENGATARLLRIPAGQPVPEHTHGGLELTLVLAGAFSDKTGVYRRGDLQEADESMVHQPQAAPGEDCICLAVTDAPLRFSSFGARLMQPLLGI